jgi:tetratricopeptide (TPR) repeat protein
MTTRSPLPKWIRKSGIFALPGSVLLAALLIYEQTYLTWAEGPQMVGFALAHAFTGLSMFGLLSWLVGAIALISGLAYAGWKRVRITSVDWSLLVALATFTLWVFVPYGSWQTLTIRILGEGKHVDAQMSYAAATGDYRLVRFLTGRGVPFNDADPNIHIAFAEGLRKEGDLDGAIREYQKAVALTGDSADAYFGMGQTLEQKGDFQSALEHFQKGCAQIDGKKCCDQADKLARRLNQ